MNVNKKLDRFKQWAGERMGGDVKTTVSDDFKALELEMGLRQEGVYNADRYNCGRVNANICPRTREDAAIHERLHQGNLEAVRGRGQREDAPHRVYGRYYDITWRRFRA